MQRLVLPQPHLFCLMFSPGADIATLAGLRNFHDDEIHFLHPSSFLPDVCRRPRSSSKVARDVSASNLSSCGNHVCIPLVNSTDTPKSRVNRFTQIRHFQKSCQFDIWFNCYYIFYSCHMIDYIIYTLASRYVDPDVRNNLLIKRDNFEMPVLPCTHR